MELGLCEGDSADLRTLEAGDESESRWREHLWEGGRDGGRDVSRAGKQQIYDILSTLELFDCRWILKGAGAAAFDCAYGCSHCRTLRLVSSGNFDTPARPLEVNPKYASLFFHLRPLGALFHTNKCQVNVPPRIKKHLQLVFEAPKPLCLRNTQVLNATGATAVEPSVAPQVEV